MTQNARDSLEEPLRLNRSLQEVPIEDSDAVPELSASRSFPEVQEEEMESSEVRASQSAKSLISMRRCQIASIVCVVISLMLVAAFPAILSREIVKMSIDQMILTPETQKLWAHFPGDSEVEIVRNFTFFRLDNEEDVVIHNHKPVFREISGFKVTELEDFLDITYTQDGAKATFKDWLRFATRDDSRSIESKVRVLNLGALGYWSTLKVSRQTLLLQQGLAILFTNMQMSIVPTVIGQGISSQFLPNPPTVTKNILMPAGIDEVTGKFMWEDVNFGFSNKNHISFWANASISCFTSKGFRLSRDALYLKNYFGLANSQMEFIVTKMQSYVESLHSILLENHYCDQVTSAQCTGRYLSVQQLTQSTITMDTPPVASVTPTSTICTDNSTCNGFFPELSSFYHNVYMSRHPGSDPNLRFDPAIVHGWMDYNKTSGKLNYNTDQNCLLHIGNLDAIWGNATLYRQTRQSFYLQNIQKRLKLPSLEQTKIALEWLEYLTTEFVLQNQTNERLGLSSLFSTGLYAEFAKLQDALQPFILSKLVQKQLRSTNCTSFFADSLQTTNLTLTSDICKHYDNFGTEEFAQQMIEVCDKKFYQSYQEFKSLGIKLTQLEQFCEPTSTSTKAFGYLLHYNKVLLNDHYGCTQTPSPYCSDFELAAVQWSTSKVTLNVLPELVDDLQPNATFANWNPSVKAVEYSFFKMKFSSEEQTKFPSFSVSETFQAMNFDSWFSSSVVLRKIRKGEFDQYLMKYIRYVSLYITLGGFTTERKVSELLFGYNDQFLLAIKEAYPPFGGDPSTPAFIALNDLNVTLEEVEMMITLKTGKADFRDLYQYAQINGLDYLNVPESKFNGNITVDRFVSPWIGEDTFYGTSGKLLAPNQFEANNVSLYIPNLQRYGSGPFTDCSETERFGVTVYECYIGEELQESTQTSDRNKRYFQTFEAAFNETSVVGIPLQVTKNHFMNCTSNWSTLVEIWNEDKSIHYMATSHWDDTFLPYTGVSFQSTIYLQSNYYQKADELLPFPQEAFLPVFSVYRSGNLSETKANTLYSPLVTGLIIKNVIMYLGIALLIVSLCLAGFFTYRLRKMKKETAKHHLLEENRGDSLLSGNNSQIR